jgi:MOSC domain-containing protein YiiM
MKVIAVSCDDTHRFSKPNRRSIRLIAGYGIEGDAHAGRFIKHRYQARQMPEMPNNRQVHLIQSELFDEVKEADFVLAPGDLGENITTSGLDLIGLPLGTLLHLGRTAVVELTGLRTPCGFIDKFQKGLKRAMIVKTPGGVTFRAGVLGVVTSGGDVAPNDAITVEMPMEQSALPAI